MKVVLEREFHGPLTGKINLGVRLQVIEDLSATDRVRAEVSMDNGEGGGMILIGGADIVLFGPSPLFSVIPHATEFVQNGLMLSVSSALIGAVGPKIGKCLGTKDVQGRMKVRACIEAQIDQLLADAVGATKSCLDDR